MPYIVAGIFAVVAIIDSASEANRKEAQAYRQATEERMRYYREEADRLDREYQEYMDRYYYAG